MKYSYVPGAKAVTFFRIRLWIAGSLSEARAASSNMSSASVSRPRIAARGSWAAMARQSATFIALAEG